MSDYSKDKCHKINDDFGIYFEASRTVRGRTVGNCWRVYSIASGRDEYATYTSAELAAHAATDLSASKRAAAAEAPAVTAPRQAARKSAPARKSPSRVAAEIGASYGVNGQIWDNA